MNNNPVNIDSLQSLPLFHNLNETECRQIAETVQMHTFSAGDTIVRQDETSRNLWIIVKGSCEVSRQLTNADGKSESIILAKLAPHQHFGEMSFFHPAPHSANVIAKTDVVVLKISHLDYNDLIAEGVWAAYKLAFNVIEGLAERMRKMDQWVADLLSHHASPDAPVLEWSEFRERLFNRWNG
ncbi:MAG: cyclic nucleotide-binding domain-containing protein [Planctomycetota bacterium]|nr:cyclic nucleotide-binding domain-containing protein [Planctomycetota bacterium]